MNKNERIYAFLSELDKLTEKYGLEVTAEGTSPLLLDKKEGGYVAAFGRSFFGGDYTLYED